MMTGVFSMPGSAASQILRGALVPLSLGAALLSSAGAAVADPSGAGSSQGVAFTEGNTPSKLRPGSIGCTIVDPARMPGWQPVTSVDRPACAGNAVAPSRELWRIQRADVAMSLRFAGGGQRGLGMLRGLMTYGHGLDLGPLMYWQFHAEAQLNAAPMLDAEMPLEERARFALSPPVLAGWGLRFEAGGVARGVFDPATAPQQHIELAAEASRGFKLTKTGREHRVKLRVARESAQDLLEGTEQQKTSASLGYSHTLDIGTIGAELDIARSTPGYAETVTDTRIAISFSHAF
jgi:hypothetical protein